MLCQSTLMIGTGEISDTSVYSSTLTRLIAREDFRTFIRRESLQSFTTAFRGYKNKQ
jgi:hypothetical protein